MSIYVHMYRLYVHICICVYVVSNETKIVYYSDYLVLNNFAFPNGWDLGASLWKKYKEWLSRQNQEVLIKWFFPQEKKISFHLIENCSESDTVVERTLKSTLVCEKS